MNISILLALLVLVAGSFKASDPGEDDLVSSVPGYTQSTPRVFANYFYTKSNQSLHYVLVQSKTGADNSDPLTLWIGDGPGCSSKLGFLSQIGPFFLPANSDYNSSIMLEKNLNSWHNLSNLLFIDGPLGVGYSFTDDGSILYNDQNTAQSNFQALLYFLKQKFPSYIAKQFYIAGQSYAGKFIPDLALRINSYNFNGDIKINLRGILVGNGVMDFSDSGLQKSQISYMFSRNFIDPTLDKYWQQSCQTDPASAGCQFFFRRYDQILNKVNFHTIYGQCYQESIKGVRSKSLNSYQSKKVQFYNTFKKCQKHGGIQSYFSLNVGDFRGKSSNFFMCNQTVYTLHEQTQSGSMNQYARLIAETTIRIHFYAGDWDDIVPFTNTIRNIERLGLRQNGQIRPWINTKTQQHVGFKRSYIQGQRQIKFWIIKGAGHEVSRHKRDVAFQLFRGFINNEN